MQTNGCHRRAREHYDPFSIPRIPTATSEREPYVAPSYETKAIDALCKEYGLDPVPRASRFMVHAKPKDAHYTPWYEESEAGTAAFGEETVATPDVIADDTDVGDSERMARIGEQESLTAGNPI